VVNSRFTQTEEYEQSLLRGQDVEQRGSIARHRCRGAVQESAMQVKPSGRMLTRTRENKKQEPEILLRTVDYHGCQKRAPGHHNWRMPEGCSALAAAHVSVFWGRRAYTS
jgi:hypothetical protein